MELAALGGIRCRLWLLVHLRIFRPVSDHPRFSVGESFALQHRRHSAASRSVPSLLETASYSTVQWVNLTETIAVRATGTSIERHQCDEGWPAIDAASLT